MSTIKSWFAPIIILFFLWTTIYPCIAIEPSWRFTYGEREIKSLAVAPDGSAIVAGTGKVLLISKNGTLLANEPFGEMVVQSRDGSTIVSEYSSVVSSTIYLFKKKKDSNGNLFLEKQWEVIQAERVGSFAISDNGDRVALSTFSKGINVYDGKTGKRLGYDKIFSKLVAMSPKGATIAAISMTNGLRLYSSRGVQLHKYAIMLPGEPNSFLMNASGDSVVFNAGPQIIAFNLSNGSPSWKVRSSGDVNMLAMTPSGTCIAAGTENGVIEFYNAKGNLTWKYLNNGQAVKAVALTRDGSKIIAGSNNGKILLLDSTGNLLWMYETGTDHITQVAIAADGSLAVAAGVNTLYAFSIAEQGTLPKGSVLSKKTPTVAFTQGNASSPPPENNSITRFNLSTPRKIIPETPTVNLTEYSVIRKATQSPVNQIVSITALIVIAFFVSRRNNYRK